MFATKNGKKNLGGNIICVADDEAQLYKIAKLVELNPHHMCQNKSWAVSISCSQLHHSINAAKIVPQQNIGCDFGYLLEFLGLPLSVKLISGLSSVKAGRAENFEKLLLTHLQMSHHSNSKGLRRTLKSLSSQSPILKQVLNNHSQTDCNIQYLLDANSKHVYGLINLIFAELGMLTRISRIGQLSRLHVLDQDGFLMKTKEARSVLSSLFSTAKKFGVCIGYFTLKGINEDYLKILEKDTSSFISSLPSSMTRNHDARDVATHVTRNGYMELLHTINGKDLLSKSS